MLPVQRGKRCGGSRLQCCVRSNPVRGCSWWQCCTDKCGGRWMCRPVAGRAADAGPGLRMESTGSCCSRRGSGLRCCGPGADVARRVLRGAHRPECRTGTPWRVGWRRCAWRSAICLRRRDGSPGRWPGRGGSGRRCRARRFSSRSRGCCAGWQGNRRRGLSCRRKASEFFEILALLPVGCGGFGMGGVPRYAMADRWRMADRVRLALA